MTDVPADQASDPTRPGRYEIRVQGHLGPRWVASFDGMALTAQADGTTCISGPVVDQAALHGVLQRVRDLGLRLVSVNRTAADSPHPAPHSLDDATS
jgi:hypothetical protein